MTKQEFQEFFSKPYPGAEGFIDNVILPIFGTENYTESYRQDILSNSNNQEIAEKTGIISINLIGEINPGAYPINFYEVEVKNFQKLRRSRSNLQAIIRKETKESFNGAFILFYDAKNKDEWRFSFFDKGESNKEITTAKRYTYLLGEGQQCRTAAERFEELFKTKNIGREEILKAFSVEALSKDFYKKLFDWYQWTLSPEVKITFPNNTNTAEDDRLKLEEQIIRLVTRLMFVWFIKQKNLVPAKFFEKEEVSGFLKDFDAESSENGNYYNAVLQNLFFATLNKAIPERAFAKLKSGRDIKTLYRYAEMFKISESEILELFRPIPFLNGGLFECLDKEDSKGDKYFLDGFSRNDSVSANGNLRHRAFIPNCVFFDEQRGIIPLLKQYNFTVEENSPAEQQVALDPELLGNIFENLLGAFNIETKETARKQSGSFYTPREIVDYMVDESLMAYLQNTVPQVDENSLRELFRQDSLPESIQKEPKLTEAILEKIKAVKILDPACGSGAFPMGILQRMTDLLDKLEPASKENHYELKLHLIENCIYGVDIQTIAAQISKLRFFISLIVEQGEMDISKPESNYGVITLPNLETKFVIANTLIGRGSKVGQMSFADMESDTVEKLRNELLNIRHEHFSAKNANSKKNLREKDREKSAQLGKILEEEGILTSTEAQLFASWNPYDQNETAPFFDSEWMFGLKEGFDIVIGNPPYIQLQKEGGKLAKQFQAVGYKTFAKTGDIYSLFYERGWQMLKDKGILCYITSNKWMRAGYGESTRKFFIENTDPKILIDFAGQKIFEAATVDTNILLFSKDKNRQQTRACTVKEKVLNNLSDYVMQNATVCHFSSHDSWVILSEIEQNIKRKIEAVGVPLKDWDINIYRGILTGYNEAFIISGEKKEEILKNCKTPEERTRTIELIRPLLRGRDIKRYSYEFADLYIITTFPSLKIDIELYPAIKEHLKSFGYDRLKQTGEPGARKKTNNKWFETQDSIGYWEEFSKQKITYIEIMTDNPNMGYEFPCFSFDKNNCITLNTAYILTGNVDELKHILGILNSKLGRLLVKNYVVQLQQRQFRMLNQYVINFPIPKIKNTSYISKLVDKIYSFKKELRDTLIIEQEIDSEVYKIFEFNSEEVEFIKNI